MNLQMNKANQISEVWLKAAILGATWAASEIILGSFLHNLRIPFNGNILTAIGFILMIAASYKWKDKGLFWRSGLICALMKTMSPSAVIFGPMIAIFMESVLLEISVRTLGRNAIGFMLGSALAMSWILFQKIANYIIFYGFNIVEIYKQLMGFANKQIKTDFDLVWMPIVVLLLIYILFGMVAVFLGMRIGKSLDHKSQNNNLSINRLEFDFLPKQNQDFPYSLSWLWIDLIILIGMLFLINMSPIYIWIPATLTVILIWTQRYKRGLRQLSKPSFWIGFVVITMLTAFVITSIQGDEDKWLKGLIIGLQMNFRAAVVIVGFAVLGTELYNPTIRNYFAKTSFKQLPVALELAFESLPVIINHLPEVKAFFKKPGDVIRNLITLAEKRLNEIRPQSNVLLISGDYAQGKTNFIKHFLTLFEVKNLNLAGFYAPRILDQNETIGYDLVEINTGKPYPFLSLAPSDIKGDIGKFTVNADTLFRFQKSLTITYDKPTLVILDEIGKWELQEKGWFQTIQHLSKQSNVLQVWIVRNDFVPEILNRFQIHTSNVISIESPDAEKTLFQQINNWQSK
jgi:nucleoside-triphosphatase THEP1